MDREWKNEEAKAYTFILRKQEAIEYFTLRSSLFTLFSFCLRQERSRGSRRPASC